MDTVSFLNHYSEIFVRLSWIMLLQSSILILILLGLDLLLRWKVRAIFRYSLWMLVLIKLVLPVGLALPCSPAYYASHLLPETKEADLPQSLPETADVSPMVDPADDSIPYRPVLGTPTVPAPPKPVTASEMDTIMPPSVISEDISTQQAHVSISWQTFACLGWIVTVLVMLVLLVQRFLFVNSLIRQSTLANEDLQSQLKKCASTMGIWRQVDLRISPNATSPSVCGLIRSIILIPDNLTDHLDARRVDAILMHELGHIKRGDLWINLVQTLLQIIYFYNPLLWIANAVIRRVREQAVDEMVLVAMDDQAQDYPETLLSVSKLVWSKPMLSLRLIGVVESKSALTGRIKHILSRPFPKSAKIGIIGLVAIFITAAVLLPMARGEKPEISSQKIEEDFCLLLLDDCKRTYEEKVSSEDKLYLLDSELKIKGTLSGLNICRTIGGNHVLAVDQQRKTLWIAEFVGDRLWHIDLKTGDILHTLNDFEAQSVAIDPQTGNAWVLTSEGIIYGKDLKVVSPEGKIIARYDIGGQDIVYSNKDNCFWVVSNSVFKVGLNGGVLGKIENQIPWCAVSVGVDENTGNAWIAVRAHPQVKGSKDEIWIVSNAVEVIKKIDIDEMLPFCVSVDSNNKVVWIGCIATTLRFTTEGEKLISARQCMAGSVVHGFTKDDIFIASWQADYVEHAKILNDGTIEISIAENFGKSQKWLAYVPFSDAKLKDYKEIWPSSKSIPNSEQPTENSAYTVTLPNGVTVELLGICKNPSKGKQWWKPDGSSLETPPYDSMEGKGKNDEEHRCYELAIHLSNIPKDIIDTKWFIPRASSTFGSTHPMRGDKYLRNLWIKGVQLSRFQKTTDLQFGVATGKWETRTVFKNFGSYGNSWGGIIVSPIMTKKNGATEVMVTHNVINSATRIVAIDSMNNIHLTGGNSFRHGTGGLQQIRGLFPGLRKEEIKEFHFQTRPYETATFKNVSLRPGRETEVMVESSVSSSQSSEENAKVIQDQIEILENCKAGEREKWFAAVKTLVDIGSPAVPALSDAIRKTNRPRAQSTMALTLRAIGDPQAVPALIDALEKSGFSSDYGVGKPDTELAKFIHRHQINPSKDDIGLGRPVREITIALERLTGHTEGREHFHICDENGNRLGNYIATPEIRNGQKEHRQKVAQRWRSWWQKLQKSKSLGGGLLMPPEGLVLEFHILPEPGKEDWPDLTPEDIVRYRGNLQAEGPWAGAMRGDSYQWVPIIDGFQDNGLIVETYQGKRYANRFKGKRFVLHAARGAYAMHPDNSWGLKDVVSDLDDQGRPAIRLTFDPAGAEKFNILTKNNINRRLAIVMEGKVITAPHIMMPLSKQVIITGDFADDKIEEIVTQLKKGMPPVTYESPDNKMEGEVVSDTMQSSISSSQTFGEEANIVHGFVTDVLGRPRGNVYVATSLSNLRNAIRTDQNGYFTLKPNDDTKNTWIAYSKTTRAVGLISIPKKHDEKPLHIPLNLTYAKAEGRIVGPDGMGLTDKQIELVITTDKGMSYHSQCYRKTDKYGNYTCSIPSGAGLTIQARLVDADESEKKYNSELVALKDGQIFVQIPTFVIGQGNPEISDDGRIHYSGRILNEDAQPIEGVKLKLNYHMPGNMSMWGKEMMTDKQGRWSCRIEKDHSDLSVRLIHPDYLSYHFDQSSRKPSIQELLEGTNVMVLKRGYRLAGTIRDPQGKPLENALVAAGRLYSGSQYGILEDATTARTTMDGTFKIGGLPADKIDIMVSAIGYAPAIKTVEIKPNMEPVDVVLEKGITYTGQVVDVDGNPLEGVKISVDDWRIGNGRHSITRITKTDSRGLFMIDNLPLDGTIEFAFGKKGAGLLGFSREMPKGLSGSDRIVMYARPEFSGQVIDAETNEPITRFQVTNGIKPEGFGDSITWSKYYKKEIKSEDGSFDRSWRGYYISYPFNGACYMKIQADGYLPEITPPVELGKEYEPFVIKLVKAQTLNGIVVDYQGNPLENAQVGWVGLKQKAFIKNGKFDSAGYVRQTDTIVKTNKQGQFKLQPSREEGLIVILHEKGYSALGSKSLIVDKPIQLTPWARITGTIIADGSKSKDYEVSVQPIISMNEGDPEKMNWMFDSISFSQDKFTINHIPSIPLYIGKIVRWEQSDSVYLTPQPGETHEIRIGGTGCAVAGKIITPKTHEGIEIAKAMPNPRQVHAAAFQITPESELPVEISEKLRSSFLWLWRDAKTVYERSRTYQKRFIPEITEDGQFQFDNLSPGSYEFVVNVHLPLGENVSCGRGTLKGTSVVGFDIRGQDGPKVIQLPDINLKLLEYPVAGEKAPNFQAKTFDGKTINLKDFRGKVVLLDFWATWCRPCVDQIPELQKIYDTFGTDDRFEMISLSLDWDVEKAKRFISDKGLQWHQVSLRDMSKSLVVKEYGVGEIPALILIDVDGKILVQNISSDVLKSAIQKVLEKTNLSGNSS